MYDPAEEEARAARTARQQANDFEKAMKKITLHAVDGPAIRQNGKRRFKRAIVHRDFNLGGKRK